MSFVSPSRFVPLSLSFSILLRFSPAVWSTHPHASTPSWLALSYRVMTGDHEIPGISRGRSSEIRSGTRTVFLHGNEGLAAWKKARTRPTERDHTECRYSDGTPYENFLIDCLIVLSGDLSPVLLSFFFFFFFFLFNYLAAFFLRMNLGNIQLRLIGGKFKGRG